MVHFPHFSPTLPLLLTVITTTSALSIPYENHLSERSTTTSSSTSNNLLLTSLFTNQPKLPPFDHCINWTLLSDTQHLQAPDASTVCKAHCTATENCKFISVWTIKKNGSWYCGWWDREYKQAELKERKDENGASVYGSWGWGVTKAGTESHKKKVGRREEEDEKRGVVLTRREQKKKTLKDFAIDEGRVPDVRKEEGQY